MLIDGLTFVKELYILVMTNFLIFDPNLFRWKQNLKKIKSFQAVHFKVQSYFYLKLKISFAYKGRYEAANDARAYWLIARPG